MKIGVSSSDHLVAFAAIGVSQFGTACLHDVKFYTSEDGRGLQRCPYAKEFLKQMTLYKDDFNFDRALLDFCKANHAEAIAYDPNETELKSSADLVPVDAAQLAGALKMLRTSWICESILKNRGQQTPRGVLAYYIESLVGENLDEARDSTVPVRAILYGLIATGVVEQKERADADLKRLEEIVVRLGKRPDYVRVEISGGVVVPMNFRDGAAEIALHGARLIDAY